MALSHLFAHCDDALCVAEDTAVAFFAPKTLKKFRVERFSGARVSGLYIQRVGRANVLHVIDSEGNWFVVGLKDLTLASSATIHMPTGEAAVAAGKPVIASRRARQQGSSNDLATAAGISEAHFHEVEGVLRCALLTATGVWEVVLLTSAAQNLAATPVIVFPVAMEDCLLAVGQRTGVVCVAQKGQRWLQFSTLEGRIAAAGAVTDAQQQLAGPNTRRVLHIAVESVSCSPVSDSVAVGGGRGELMVFPSIADPHFFSDHWHHTALTALSFTVDGTSLLTGARESVLLVWNLDTYTHRKISCNLGPIRCVVPSSSTGSTLLLACGVATLGTIDLLQMRLQAAVEGIEWSSGQSCRGLVVDTWMGRPTVVLTGLPNVLRLCDPLTQQAVYSLHISSQMETIPSPPRHGIQFAGMLKEGRVIVTYESFPLTALPAMLRFWVYDAAKKQHVEAQTIYKPHDSEVVALQVDKTNSRVFTLSRDDMKCWTEVLEDPNDALNTRRRSWRNQSTSPASSSAVASLALSADGSLCLVADDSVHVYSVADCRPGERWQEVFTLCQSAGTAPLKDVAVFSDSVNVQEGSVAVVARDEERAYLWNLVKPDETAVVFEAATSASAGATITALCRYTEDSILVARSNLSFVALSCKAAELGKVVGEVQAAVTHPVVLMAPIPGTGNRIAVVDTASGFRVLNVSVAAKTLEEERFTGKGLRASDADGGDDAGAASLNRYFNDLEIADGAGDGRGQTDAAARLGDAARTARAGTWLREVLHEPAYTAPSMSSVLSLYMKRRSGTN